MGADLSTGPALDTYFLVELMGNVLFPRDGLRRANLDAGAAAGAPFFVNEIGDEITAHPGRTSSFLYMREILFTEIPERS